MRIAEAVQRPTMKFVAVKTAEQLDLQALHTLAGNHEVGQLSTADPTIRRSTCANAASIPRSCANHSRDGIF